MKIAFYAPLKSPDHPVPSGDRLMARQLLAALSLAGHEVELASTLRAFHGAPDADVSVFAAEAASEVERLTRQWQGEGAPDLWFCYHPYYKAPDRLGPTLCRAFGIPYVTAEASYSNRRNLGLWAAFQGEVLEAVRLAAVNLCFTGRDQRGLSEAAPEASLASIFPFIDPAPFLKRPPQPEPGRLVTVAMMRPGDKLMSYRALARALKRIEHLPWRLTVIGDGPARNAAEAAFSLLDPARIDWRGEQKQAAVAEALSQSALYLWPGHGEAYGLAYLEAQAAGLPVIAEAVAGVPEVVNDGQTGLLTAPGDDEAYAEAIAALLADPGQAARLGRAGRDFVRHERSIEAAAARLDCLLQEIVTRREGQHEQL
ncbi:glycosyltransferase family 4 protein [Rhizobium paknamense]|uniref:Glycosyltransferase involved in cell wall biosynthesis n=1 Tax=Rhizobium paknamense TaxID=1206817 RepID=A0ABU0ID00_9HYPH|nr:glycosyltransferase family 4 protein [Rhizobium paknamense]MDQ0456119.1 glycosyltransferase involved in cell wall biosynthesis [Rhizobium paknamense]